MWDPEAEFSSREVARIVGAWVSPQDSTSRRCLHVFVSSGLRFLSNVKKTIFFKKRILKDPQYSNSQYSTTASTIVH